MPRIKYDPVANALDAIAAKNPIKQLSKGLIQTPTGINVNTFEMWNFLPKAQEIRASRAQQILSVGGTRSGKSVNAIMIGVIDFLPQVSQLRRFFLFPTDLRSIGSGSHPRTCKRATFFPRLYTFNESKKLHGLHEQSLPSSFGHMLTVVPESESIPGIGLWLPVSDQ